MVREKKSAATAKAKPAANKPSSKPSVEEIESVVICKDYVNVRWEITEAGQLATWQPEDEGQRPSLSIVPGKISDVVFDKMCAYVGDDGKKTTVQKLTKNNLRN